MENPPYVSRRTGAIEAQDPQPSAGVRFDVVVIGAGAAGLAAARDLSGAGRRVCLVKARGRIGGRVHTLHLPDLPLPIELGAEFIHGEVGNHGALPANPASRTPSTVNREPPTHWTGSPRAP